MTGRFRPDIVVRELPLGSLLVVDRLALRISLRILLVASVGTVNVIP
jgi:hypothetical protein